MILGALLALTVSASGDQSGWHNYSPPGSGVYFSMPGTVHGETEPDPTGGSPLLHRYRSEVDGREYTVVFGEVSDQYKPVVTKLWDQDRNGGMVKKILDNTLKAAASASGGKVRLSKFGDLHGFPILAQMLDNPDNTGTNIFAAFTKRGIVIASAKTPKSEADVKEGMKFIGSISLKDRG